MMDRKNRMMRVGLLSLVCFMMVGCVPLQNKIEAYSNDKVVCYLNTENVTQFDYQSKNYTILNDTVSNSDLGDLVGYIRQMAAVNESGQILFQENMIEVSVQTLADITQKAPDAAYTVPFLNVYAAPNDNSYLIVDVNGAYHKAVPTKSITEADAIFDYKAAAKNSSNAFVINPENATQLICDDITYQMTEETIATEKLGNFLAVLAQNVTFDADTKKPLSKNELNRMDWAGENHQRRENWFYTDVYEVRGFAVSEAVAVEVNNQYYLAKAQ